MALGYKDRAILHTMAPNDVSRDVLQFHSKGNWIRKSRFGYGLTYVGDVPPEVMGSEHSMIENAKWCIAVDQCRPPSAPLRRHSQRTFDSNRAVPWPVILQHLMGSFAARPAPDRGRPCASAGTMYPVEIFLLVLPSRIANMPKLDATVFRFRPVAQVLEPLLNVTEDKILAVTTDLVDRPPLVEYNNVEYPAFFLFYGINIDTCVSRYRYRGYRFALIEAGAMCHQASLVADGLGLSNCLIGGFGDNELGVTLGINPAKILPTIAQCFGFLDDKRSQA